MRTPISISLDQAIVDEIETRRGAISRSRFVELLIARALWERRREVEVGAFYA